MDNIYNVIFLRDGMENIKYYENNKDKINEQIKKYYEEKKNKNILKKNL